MHPSLSRALIAFRIVLGVVLLYGSLSTAIHGGANLARGPSHFHLLLLGSIEALGALLLLIPRTLQAGAVLLAVTIGGAFLVHLFRGEFRPDLLVYLTGVVLVAVHGWTSRAGAASTSEA